MGDKSVCWWEPDEFGGWTAGVGAVYLEVSLDADDDPVWSVAWYGDEMEHGSAESAEQAKRAAIEAARRVLRESGEMLDALERSSAEPRKGTVGGVAGSRRRPVSYHLRRYKNSPYWYARITRPDGSRGNWKSTRKARKSDARHVAEQWDSVYSQPSRKVWADEMAKMPTRHRPPRLQLVTGGVS